MLSTQFRSRSISFIQHGSYAYVKMTNSTQLNPNSKLMCYFSNVLERWPFDWKTPSGYLVAWIGQCAGVGTIITIPITFFNTVFGSKWLFMVIAEDITSDLTAFNNDVDKMQTISHRAESIQRFCTIIQLYTDAKLCVSCEFF